MAVRSLVALTLLAVSTTAAAQEMRPISEIMEIQPTQVFVRCAGLYSAVGLWAGEERLGRDLWEQMEYSMQINLANASLAYQRTGVATSDQQAIDIAMRDMNSAIDLYHERFSRNVAATGEAFGQDQLVTADFEICRAITEQFAPQQ